MKYLVLDCSGPKCLVALSGAQGVCDISSYANQANSQALMPMISSLLEQEHCKCQSLDGIAVGVGPGSFVGVRLAVSVAQGLAWAGSVPLVGFSSFRLWAQTAYETTSAPTIALATDARAGMVYTGLYRASNGVMMPVQPDQAMPVSEFEHCPGADLYLGDMYSQGDGFGANSIYAAQAKAAISWLQPKDFANCCSPDTVLPVYLQGTTPWRKQHA